MFWSVKSPPRNSFLPDVLFIRQRSVCTSEFPKSSFLASEMAILPLFGLVRGGHFVFYADVDDRLATCSYCFQYRQEFRFFGFQTIKSLFFAKYWYVLIIDTVTSTYGTFVDAEDQSFCRKNLSEFFSSLVMFFLIPLSYFAL